MYGVSSTVLDSDSRGRHVFLGLIEYDGMRVCVKDVFESNKQHKDMRRRLFRLNVSHKSKQLLPGTLLYVAVKECHHDGRVDKYCEPCLPPGTHFDGVPSIDDMIVSVPGDALAASYGLAASFFLDPAFSTDVMDEVNFFLENPGLDDPSLADLTDVPFVTIDGEHSKDLDQALFVRTPKETDPHPEAQWVVYYALADASYYVRPGSAL